MNTSVEVQVLQWFERALAQKPEHRRAWLDGQELDPPIRDRVLRLLDADRASAGFPEETVVAPEEAPAEFPKVGERLGPWELLKPLEAGGMGVVYLGRRADDAYDQQVAIKLVRPVHLLAAADFRRQLISRFEEERNILARMSHPNVARILDGGSTSGGIPYLVMEFVDGVPLTDYCRQNKLDLRGRLVLFGKVCDGVQEAHRHLIVHRDLKPDNILVGANGEPRLLDFGIAKILEAEPLDTGGKRQTSLSAMTPAYASPEQVRQQRLTTSSDVYSLGVMLYQLIAGVRPYELGGLRPSEAEHVVCETLPDPMRKMLDKAVLTDAERRQRRAQITPDIERIVAKAMHKESARRYGSAQELADDIRRYLAGLPVQAHPDSTAYRVRKFVRRNRWGVLAASLALVAVLASAGVAFWQAGEARRAESDANRINKFLTGILTYSDPYVSGGEMTLAEAVDSSLATVDAFFADRPDLLYRIRQTLGSTLLGRGRTAEARELLELALKDAVAIAGKDSMPVMEIRQALVQVLSAEQRTGEAVDAMEALRSDMRLAGLEQSDLYFTVLANLGELKLGQDDHEAAAALFAEARAMPAEILEMVPANTMAVLVSNEAYVAYNRGRYEEAEALFDQADAMHRRVHPAGSPDLWILQSNRAFMLDEMGRQQEALALREAVLEEQRRQLGPDHPFLLKTMSSLALGALQQGDLETATKHMRATVELSRAEQPQPSPDTVIYEGMLARILRDAGELEAAEDTLAQAEARLAGLEPVPEELARMISIQRSHICARARALDLPRCAGVPPPPND
ncbi:protein kinase [Arenimonas sp.]|uniref:serine/threonine protein kinase n=1 Tax=Arenimonas sp. TaxID=1872635 RepID=UPI0035AEBDC7